MSKKRDKTRGEERKNMFKYAINIDIFGLHETYKRFEEIGEEIIKAMNEVLRACKEMEK